MYVRKTYDYFDLEQFTEEGWEVVTAELTLKEIRERKREYQENQPGYLYRIKKRRARI